MLGRPDFVFPVERVAVFVDGCFWHGCPRCRNEPRTNAFYWAEKNRRNMARDRFVSRTLAKREWAVVRVWEHSLRRSDAALSRIKSFLRKRRRRGRAP
jgi:DNA mismatch endonuclease (patch repair protein)